MATEAEETNMTTSTHASLGQHPSDELRSDDRSKTPRHPRWTRQETLVLIQAKKIAEERGRKRGRSGSMFGLDHHHHYLEPKWDFVSSYCTHHGLTRGSVQCRKRWSNLASDFKKIKTWESQLEGGGGESESFWIMRSDVRRDRRLPGFFDRDVYDVLNGKPFTGAACQLALVAITSGDTCGDEEDDDAVEEEDEETESDATPLATPEGIGGNAEREETRTRSNAIPSPVPISEMRNEAYEHAYTSPGVASKQKQFRKGSSPHERMKKRRHVSSEKRKLNLEDRLITTLERNTNMLNAHLEEQKMSSKLDKEQKNEHHDSLIAALTKITGALEQIVDRL